MLLEYHHSHCPCTELNDAATVIGHYTESTACNSTTSAIPKGQKDG